MSERSPFTQGLAQGRLRYLRCAACDGALTGQRHACPRCGSLQLHWCDAAGRGTVYAVSTVHRAPSEAFRALLPYTLVLVDLDEGFRVMAHGAPDLAIGERVSAHPLQVGSQPLIRFERQRAP